MFSALLLATLAGTAQAAEDDAPELTFETWNLGLAHGFVDYA